MTMAAPVSTMPIVQRDQQALPPVSSLPRVGVRAARSLDDELERHIEDAEHQWLTAFHRFQDYGLPHDRDEALLHLHRMNVALMFRSAAAQAARRVVFQRMLDEGVAYFSSDYVLAIGRGGAA